MSNLKLDEFQPCLIGKVHFCVYNGVCKYTHTFVYNFWPKKKTWEKEAKEQIPPQFLVVSNACSRHSTWMIHAVTGNKICFLRPYEFVIIVVTKSPKCIFGKSQKNDKWN